MTTSRVRLRVALLVVLAVLWGGDILFAQGAGDPIVRERVEEILRSGPYDTDGTFGEEDASPLRPWDLGFAGKVLMWVLAAAVFGGLAFILFLFGRWAVRGIMAGRGRREPRLARAPPSATRPIVAVSPSSTTAPTVAEADALASAGRLQNALHHLLVVALWHLSRGGRVILEEDVTAREAARTADLSDDQRPHLDRLVRDAELAHFGDRPVDIEGYGAARGACVSLLVSEGVRP